MGIDSLLLMLLPPLHGIWHLVHELLLRRELTKFEEGWRARGGRRAHLPAVISEIHIKVPQPGSERVRDEL